MEVAASVHSVGLGDRILTNRLQYQTVCLRGPVPAVEQSLELRIKLELDVLVTVRFFLHVVDYPGHGDAFLDYREPLGMIDVLPQSLIASRGDETFGGRSLRSRHTGRRPSPCRSAMPRG